MGSSGFALLVSAWTLYICQHVRPSTDLCFILSILPSTPVTPALLLSGKMMMEVDKISEAFWWETPWGKNMQDTLKNRPFPK